MVAESWLRNLWKPPRKHDANSEKVVIGVLAFEVASLMSKLVNIWQSLSDKQVARLREEITNSVGIRKLVSVSDDDYFIERLICMEILENMAHVAESVARLGKKCSDPILKGFENAFYEFITMGVDPYGWEFTCKKMEKKIKRMEKFVSTNASLFQEMEVLADLEQTLTRMKASGESDVVTLIEFQKKVGWKRQEVKNLQDISLWNRTYDYAIHLLARSLFTIFCKINHVFGIQEMVDVGGANNSSDLNADFIYRSQSVSALLQSSFHPSQNNVARFSSGPLNAVAARSGPIVRTNKASISHSGPLGDSSTKSGRILGKNTNVNFYSGPLGRNSNQSVPVTTTNKRSKFWKFYGHSAAISRKETHTKPGRLTQVGPFKGCMAWDSSSVIDCHSSANGVHYGIQNPKDVNSIPFGPGKVVYHTQSVFKSLCKLLNPPPETLGAAALALHYANVIIVIEKLAASPHLIGVDARDDLYNMLPRRMKAAIKAKLKPYTKTMASSSVYDTGLAEEWTEAMSSILEWLAPLAHNMIRWQSERSFEQQSFVSRTNVLLVQTLYFANQEKTEEIITELLVGLNYVWNYSRELNAKALAECASFRIDNEYPNLNG
ncbi:protein PSK SIMULATOR 3-like [Gastrolobium bilobum]|uniref:protein PSK SIMULATOR 3-like n=1 Tax=Gastrolobium bilobum TaxID=150636 RepID=UPI002AAF308D|nr:protein PSK SIMULATOR 3-like [Gastrolobium bilobum]XP_061358279.1 protein PSK SIMULATOR 3-like [Gastrolobium bilobum]